MYYPNQSIHYNLNSDEFSLFGSFTIQDEKKAERAARDAERKYQEACGIVRETWWDRARKMLH